MAKRQTASVDFLRDAVAQIDLAAEDYTTTPTGWQTADPALRAAAERIGLHVRYGSSGAWLCSGYGFKASCTVGSGDAVRAWAGKVRATAAE